MCTEVTPIMHGDNARISNHRLLARRRPLHQLLIVRLLVNFILSSYLLRVAALTTPIHEQLKRVFDHSKRERGRVTLRLDPPHRQH